MLALHGALVLAHWPIDSGWPSDSGLPRAPFRICTAASNPPRSHALQRPRRASLHAQHPYTSLLAQHGVMRPCVAAAVSQVKASCLR